MRYVVVSEEAGRLAAVEGLALVIAGPVVVVLLVAILGDSGRSNYNPNIPSNHSNSGDG